MKIWDSSTAVVVFFDDDRLKRSFLSSSVMYGGPTSCKNASDIQQECFLSHWIRRLPEEEDSKREMKKLSPVNCKKKRELNKKVRKWEKTKNMMNLKADFICLMTQMVRHLNMITLVHTVSLQHIRYGWIMHTLRLSYAYVTAEFIIFYNFIVLLFRVWSSNLRKD